MEYVDSGAELSACRTYRYRLWREWDTGRGTVVFIGLNPSTADESFDDLTLRRCVGFSGDWGYKRLMMVNLFAYWSTYPGDLANVTDPVGPENDRCLLKTCSTADLVVTAWGNHGTRQGRDQAVCNLISGQRINLTCLGITQQGQPRHPSRLTRDLKPVDFNLP